MVMAANQQDLASAPSGTIPPGELNYRSVLEAVTAREKTIQDKWTKGGQQIWATYLNLKKDVKFNILFSNTEIIVPAVFSQRPIPAVQRRNDERKADVPAKAANRVLSYLMDTNLPSYPDFFTAVEDSVLDAALPGIGQVRVTSVDGVACLDYVPYDKFIWGYCRRWEDLPWQAYRLDLTYEDIVKTFNLSEDEAKQIKNAMPTAESGQGEDETESAGPGDTKSPSTLPVYEVWRKSDRKRMFLCDAATNCCLKIEDDPLQLENFFPSPRPLQFIRRTTSTLPVPLYHIYQQQAEELNQVTDRITRLTKAIRVRGAYSASKPALAAIFQDGSMENALVPMETSMPMENGMSLDRYIWLVPVEKLIVVLRELLTVREQIKSTIYEILGIGDILRGVSKASETLGAQKIKDKWGSLRINKARGRVEVFIKDSMRLMLEVAAKHSSQSFWKEATGLAILTSDEYKMAVEAFQQQSMQPLPPGAPPLQPPNPMTWETILRQLSDNLQRSYLIDIETNSTIDPEATYEKEDLAEFLNALGQGMSGLAPLAEQSPEGFQAAKAFLVEICKRYRFGPEMEAKIEALPVPKALQGPPPEVQKQMQEIQAKGAEVQKASEALKTQEMGIQKQTMDLQAMLAEVQRQQQALVAERKAMDDRFTMLQQEIDLQFREETLKLKEAGVALKEKKAAAAAPQRPQKP